MSALKDLFGVLTSPTATYERLRENPVWLGAMIVLLLVAIIGSLIALPKVDFADVARTQIESSSQQMTEEQMEQAIEMGSKFGKYFAVLNVFPGLPIGWLIVTLLMWVMIRMLGGVDLSFKQAFSTTINSMAPWILHSVLSIPLILGRSEISGEELQQGGVLKHSLGAFVEAEGALQQVLLSINVFSLWTVVLLGIGFAVVGKVSRGKGMAAAFGLWILGVLIKVALSGLQG